MSWLLKQSKNGKRFKIWSTITDSYVVDIYLDQEEIVDFISKEWISRTANQIKELKETFPKGWTDKDTQKII